jgi:hypothetical protein
MHLSEARERLESARTADHVVAWSPARVLAEVAAKRQILARFGHMRNQPVFDALMRLLALPYSGHPDYQQEWKPLH